jgi:hypothetical protein
LLLLWLLVVRQASSAAEVAGVRAELEAARLEAAADALKHAALILRDHVFQDVIDG